MRKILLTAVILFAVTNIYAQQKDLNKNALVIEHNKIDKTPTSITFPERSTLHKGQATEIFRNYLDLDGIDNKAVLKKTTLTKYNTTIEKYEQYYKNIKVEHGAYTILYNKEEEACFMSGHFYKTDNRMVIIPVIDKTKARDKALGTVNAQTYAWQAEGMEKQLKQEKNNEAATYYPEGELVWMEDRTLAQPDRKLHLAYKFNVYAIKPLSRENIYIDAATGKILHRQSQIDHANELPRVAAQSNDKL